MIKHLDLRNVEDETQYKNALKVMKRSKSVKNLGIINCSPKFTNKLIVKAISNLPEIESLTISNKTTERNIVLPEFPSTIKLIRTLEHLQTLEINNVYIGEDTQRQIAKFKTLKSFKINGKGTFADELHTHFSTPNFFKKLAKNCKELDTIELKEDARAGYEVSS